MFTSVDKAWAALFGGVAFLAGHYLGFDIALGAGVYDSLAVAVTAFLTWLVPNKTA